MSKKRKIDTDGCFMKDGKANICLCFKEKNRYVLCVMRRCRSSKSTIYVGILTPNTEPSMLNVDVENVKTRNCQRIKRQTAIATECVHKSHHQKRCGSES